LFFFSKLSHQIAELPEFTCCARALVSGCVILRTWFSYAELPEVETVARGLRRAILGRRIVSVTLGRRISLMIPRPGRAFAGAANCGRGAFWKVHVVAAFPAAGLNRVPTNAMLRLRIAGAFGHDGQIAPMPSAQPRENIRMSACCWMMGVSCVHGCPGGSPWKQF